MICHWFEEPAFFFFAQDLPALLYYSHIPTMIIALLVGFFVFFNDPKQHANRLLLLIALCFSAWTLINLTTWTNIHSDVIIFVWSLYGIFQALISILSVYFIHTFLTKNDVSLKIKSIFLILLAPVFFFAPSDLNINGFNIERCDAFDHEGLLYISYYTLLGVVSMLWILYLLVKYYRKTIEKNIKRQILLMGIGIEFFLFSFFTVIFLISYLSSMGWFDDSRLEFFALYGMSVFMVFMGILIVRFNAFNATMIAPQALIIALVLITGSKYTFSNSQADIILTTVTLVLVVFAGYVLIRSVRKEIDQRKEIEQLATNLKTANDRLKVLDKMKSEFVSIASHQLRSPLTSIRGYASMLIEGSFGPIPDKAKQALERIAESSKHMVSSVEDYLNVSRIESGNMKYEMADFNFKTETEKVVEELRAVAMKQGLLLTFRSDITNQGIVNADIGKTRQALHNLINNSLKYTERGSVMVTVSESKNPSLIKATISDTGVGMSQDTIAALFGKFSRAKDANKTNTSGTGLGLFVAKQMIEHMGGTITAQSEGEGKGSAFTLTLPLQQ